MILMGVEYVVFPGKIVACLSTLAAQYSNSSQKKLEVVQVAAAAAAEAVQALLLGLQ